MTTGFPLPVGMDFAPDGRLFILGHVFGDVRVVEASGELQQEPIIRIDPVSFDGNEAGAMGIAVAPDYRPEASGGYIYVSHVVSATEWRISRFWEDGKGTASQLEEVMTFPDCFTVESPYERAHNIGNIHFGPNPLEATGEEMLYVSFGDGGIPRAGTTPPPEENPAQDPDAWCGGLYYLDPDNPPDLTQAATHTVAMGLRNPFDFCFHPNGSILLSENGLNIYDEINRVTPGPVPNFGWPIVVGPQVKDDYVLPFFSLGVRTVSPTAIRVYQGDGLPSSYENVVFWGEWNTGCLRWLRLEDPKEATSEIEATGYLIGTPAQIAPQILVGGRRQRITDLEIGPDGLLYICTGAFPNDTSSGTLLRIIPRAPTGILRFY